MPVVLSGTREALASLRKIQPEAAKQVSKGIRAAAMPVVARARGYAPSEAPLSGWGIPRGIWEKRTYVANEVTSGIGFSAKATKPNNNGFSYTSYIYNKSIAGAIYETAGRKNPNGQPSQASTRGKYSSYVDTSNKVNKSANPNAGKQFIEAAGQLYDAASTGGVGRHTRKMKGRLIFRAWKEDNGKVLGAVAKGYDLVIDKFNRGDL